MAATDMVLCIVWKRAGLKLNPAIWRRSDGSAYESGTVLEFETAVDVSRKQSRRPRRLSVPQVRAGRLRRRPRQPSSSSSIELLQSVWKRWTESEEGYNTAGYQSFADPDDFEAKLEACLRQWLERKGVVAHGPHWDRKLKGSPFRGLAAFEASHAVGVLRPRGRDRARGREASAVAVPAGDRGERLGQVVAAARRPRAAGDRARRHPRRRSLAHR